MVAGEEKSVPNLSAFAFLLTLSAGAIRAGDHELLLPDALGSLCHRTGSLARSTAGQHVTTQVAVIHGDPNRAGAPFVIRLKSPPNSVLPVHWHNLPAQVADADNPASGLNSYSVICTQTIRHWDHTLMADGSKGRPTFAHA